MNRHRETQILACFIFTEDFNAKSVTSVLLKVVMNKVGTERINSISCDYSPSAHGPHSGMSEASHCRDDRSYSSLCKTDLFCSSLGNLVTWCYNKNYPVKSWKKVKRI